MPRKPRTLMDDGCYHLIARGNNRQYLFQEEPDFQRFLGLLVRAKERYPSKLFHYCLMSNHVHLLLEIASGKDLPKLMQILLQGYGRWFQKKAGHIGHVWQGRYKSPLVSRESYFLEAGRYIERNPLRAGVVQDLKDYPWSSYPFYAQGANNLLIDEDPYYQGLGPNACRRQEAYRNFVRLEHPYDKMLDQELVMEAF